MNNLTAQLLREIAEKIRQRCDEGTDGRPCQVCRVDAEDLERIAADMHGSPGPRVTREDVSESEGDKQGL